MKTLAKVLLASLLAFAATSLPASQAHAVRRRPILEAHLEGSKGRWNRGTNHDPFGHRRPQSSVTVPELDPASATSALALLLAVAMLRSRRRDDAMQLLD